MPDAGDIPETPSSADVAIGPRISLSLIGLLHGLTLGSLLPVLPLYARRTLHYSWQQTSLLLAGLSAGILAGPLLIRVGRQLRLDARLGLAASHLIAGGLIMAMAWWRSAVEVGQPAPIPTPPLASLCAALYAIALAPALTWLPEAARDVFPQPAVPGARMWRLWAAVGFVLPAWITETALVKFPQFQNGIASLDILLLFCGWGSLLTAVVALLTRGGSGESPILQDQPSQRPGMSAGLVLAIIFLVAVQKCHHLWTAPYFDEVARRNGITAPMVHRLIVVSQVFEVLGLYLMACIIRPGNARLLMAGGAIALVSRSTLLSWLESVWPHSPYFGAENQMAILFSAQALYGMSLAGFLGALGVALRPCGMTAGGGRTASLLGLATLFGVLLGGMLADALITGNSSSSLASLLRNLPPTVPRTPFSLTGWSGVWLLSAAPGTFAGLMVFVCRLPDHGNTPTDDSGAS